MNDFDYSSAASIAGAVERLRLIEDSRPLSGGMTLIPTLKTRMAAPVELVDLGRIADLCNITDENGFIAIGAMATHSAVASSQLVGRRLAGVAALAGSIGDPQVRNRGTIGGSVANNDPAADYPAALLALDATVVTDRRRIAAEDFFTGMFETALESDEIVTAIRFPADVPSAYAKFRNPVSGYALAGVFVARMTDGPRVAVTGAASAVFRAVDFEEALRADFTAEALDHVAIEPDELSSDMHASATYRAQLVKVMAKRAVAKCLHF